MNLLPKIRPSLFTLNRWSRKHYECTRPYRCSLDNYRMTSNSVSIVSILIVAYLAWSVLIDIGIICIFYALLSLHYRVLYKYIPFTLYTANYVLPKGANVTVSPIVTHHCPHLYPNPGVFNPDNFSVQNVAKRHKYSYIAFSGGPRGCIGKLNGCQVLATFFIILKKITEEFRTICNEEKKNE